jgi:hypothetical protein
MAFEWDETKREANSAGLAMAKAANDLIAELAPR